MKICTDCEFSKTVPVQTPQGWGTMIGCLHQECRDPVTGEPIPALMSRREMAFCGFNARYFKAKEEDKPKQVENVIELAK